MTQLLNQWIIPALYLASALLFIKGIKQLGSVRTARRGNAVAALGMLAAVVGTLLELGWVDYRWIIGGMAAGTAIGWLAAVRVAMTGMPGMVALLNGAGGLGSALTALSVYWVKVVELDKPGKLVDLMGDDAAAINVGLSVFIGGLTFTGSVLAYLKVQEKMRDAPINLPMGQWVNAGLWFGGTAVSVWFAYGIESPTLGAWVCVGLLALSFVLGVLQVLPIGGADMPVVISLLNSFSGIAGAAAGFMLQLPALIIAGALVGASGIILTQVMCKAMNRSLLNVLLGGFGEAPAAGTVKKDEGYRNVRSCGADEAAMVLEAAGSVVFVPGYGMAVAQCQHAVRELADLLKKRGAKVRHAIHPVAGRMPGHMNVLLAEADVPYDELIEMDAINPEFRNTDAVIVLGANDVVNPAALTNPGSPIYGMPILEVFHARTVFVIKRSLGAGFAGIKNELFEKPNTTMIFGDAKKMVQELITALKSA